MVFDWPDPPAPTIPLERFLMPTVKIDLPKYDYVQPPPGSSYYTLTAPGGHVIAKGKSADVEDRFARIIEADGFPTGTTGYVMKSHWTTDGRIGKPGVQLSRIVLGCDDGGWWQLDGSKVPEGAAPARTFRDQPHSRKVA